MSLNEFDSTPKLSFKFTQDNPWDWAAVILHTHEDLPEAMKVHPVFYPQPNKINGSYQKLDIKKKKIYRDSTRKNPCVNHYQSCCQDIKAYEMMIQKFNCKISFFNFGNHILEHLKKDYLQIGLPECDQKVVKNALSLFLNPDQTSCIETSVCNKTKFSFTMQEFDLENESASFSIGFQDPEIEHHHTLITFDLLSLFGEIGGVLGLTLGLSTMSLIQVLINAITKAIN